MAVRQELNSDALSGVAGGSYRIDETNLIVYIGKGTNVRRFQLPAGGNYSNLDISLNGCCTTMNDDQNNDKMIEFLGTLDAVEF